MSNFLQDALRALDDEESERFIRYLNMERELRIVNLWKQAERSHEQGSSARHAYMHADTAAGPVFLGGVVFGALVFGARFFLGVDGWCRLELCHSCKLWQEKTRIAGEFRVLQPNTPFRA